MTAHPGNDGKDRRLGEARRERENKPSVELSDRSAARALIPGVFYPFDELLRDLRRPIASGYGINQQLSATEAI